MIEESSVREKISEGKKVLGVFVQDY